MKEHFAAKISTDMGFTQLLQNKIVDVHVYTISGYLS